MVKQSDEVIISKVSVYEIELNLSEWAATDTKEAPDFAQSVLKVIPSMKGRTCVTCQYSDFETELKEGTHFAHVIEHVITELIRLASPQHTEYTGWTRSLKDDHVYIVHYSAPDFLTGRLAAILSIDLVKRCINKEAVEIDHYIHLLKNPLSYFNEEGQDISFHEIKEPNSIIQELKECASVSTYPAEVISLSDEQKNQIRGTVLQIRENMASITEAWRTSFLLYSGNFGAAIIDKMQLINLDHFINLIAERNFQGVAWGIKKASQVISSYHIPINFVIHSLWLYKNKLLSSIIEKYKYRDSDFTDRIIKDFENFYQLILQGVMEGCQQQMPPDRAEPAGELRKFIELKGQTGYILIIDDDEIIRRVVKDILEYHGYPTILARNGAEGLDILSKSKSDIHLVVLDVFLRDYSVDDIFPRITELCPGIKVLFISGYSISKNLEKHLSKGAVDFLMKPFSDSVLINRINSLLH
ncbi:MAG: response regulator [Deltaproteobacteria bacterium]|nr:response regulator [Deltaproteobacteria bacterium]